MREVLRAGADKVSLNTRAVADPPLVTACAASSGARPWSWRSTPAGSRRMRSRPGRGRRQGRPQAGRPRCRRVGRARRRARGRRAAGHLDRPRRDQVRLRHRAAAGDHEPRPGAGHRLERGVRRRSHGRGDPRRGCRCRPRRLDLPSPRAVDRRRQGTARGRRHSGPPGHRHGGARMSPLARPGPLDLDGGGSGHPQVGPQRPRRGRRPGRGRRTDPDGRLDGRGGARRDPRHGRRPLPSVTRPAVAQGRVHVLKLRSLALDCDGDALLIGAEPLGPTCHRETRSCFDPDALSRAVPPVRPRRRHPAPGSDPMELPGANDAWQGFAWLEDLWATIAERASSDPGSYTVELLDGGVDVAGRKSPRRRPRCSRRRTTRRRRRPAQTGPSSASCWPADLVYHALVLLAERGVEPRAVCAARRARRERRPRLTIAPSRQSRAGTCAVSSSVRRAP